MSKTAAILAAYASGKPIRKIAAQFGVCESYPTVLAKRHGLAMRGPGRRNTDGDHYRPRAIAFVRPANG